MLRTKTADRVVCIATVFMLIVSVCLWGIVKPVQGDGSHEIGYESLLFDQSRVHTIEITTDHWDEIIANATAEEYQDCTIVIDGENLGEVGIRAKGNTSLSSVASLGSTRYSFKVEFNHYAKGKTYHGLDKLSLNNLIQDATMMKDYLAYTLMGKMGVPSSLCSYAQIIVNGEPWGLYLAVEGVEDAFLERNGMTKGELYKPDSMSFGGGRGNGRDFDIENFREKEDSSESGNTEDTGSSSQESTQSFSSSGNPFSGGSFSPPEGMPGNMPEGMQMPEGGFSFPGGSFSGFSGSSESSESGEGSTNQAGGFSGFPGNSGSGEGSTDQAGSFPSQPGGGFGGGFGGFNFGMGSDDVKLVYTDDDPESYSNIFNNAKTNISNKDKTRLISSLKKLNEGEDLDSVVNKDEVITYLAVHNFLCNDDSYTGMMVHNYYLYEENGKLTILPWDYNLGFGGFSAGQDATTTVNSPIDSPVSSGTTDSRPLISWIFSDEEALAAYHESYSQFISECIESGWLEEEITRVKEMITPYVESDSSAFYTMEEFEKAVSTLKTFCAKRAESIRGQLEGTIPSTTQGQRENSAALIDASEISTADMGKMDNGNNQGGGGGFSMPGGGMPDFQSGSFTPPDGQNAGSFSMSGFPGGSFSPPSGTVPAAAVPSSENGNTETADLAETTGKPSEAVTGTAAVQGAEEKTEATDKPAETGETEANETGTNEAETAKPASAGRPNETGDRNSMPGGFAGMNDFPGRTDNTGAWIQIGICAAVLLAAVLIIRRIGAHNG